MTSANYGQTEWGNWWHRPENRAFSWPWRIKWQHWPEKEAFLWPRRWQTKKETPSKGCLRNVLCKRSFAALRMTVYNYLLSAVATSTAQATVQPTIGLLPMPRNPIISTCAGTYRPYVVRPCVSHWTSIPYEAILCRNPGRNLPERRHTVVLGVL